jgi:hypothetical protein
MHKVVKYLESFPPHWMDITWLVAPLPNTCLLSIIWDFCVWWCDTNISSRDRLEVYLLLVHVILIQEPLRMGLCPMHCQCCIMWSRMGVWCMQSQSPETTLPCSAIIHRGINPLDFTMKLWDSVNIIAPDIYSTLSCTWLDTGGLRHLT